MTKQELPGGWEEQRIRKVLADLLDGFLAASRQAAAGESEHARPMSEGVFGDLMSDYKRAREKWAEAQRATADDFNLFEVMGVQWEEVCHSRLLAWLLDPRIERGTHAQGELGFRLFLQELEKELDPQGNRGITAYADEPYWVRREFSGDESRVDIEIAARNRFIIHIENKILAAEGDAQTDHEWRDLQRRAKELAIPEEHIHAVFLTLDGSEPKKREFRPVAWNRIARVLEKFGRQAQPSDVPSIRPSLCKRFAQNCSDAIASSGDRECRSNGLTNLNSTCWRGGRMRVG